MRKIISIVIALFVIFSMSTAAMAATQITVSGTGEVLVPADTAIISLGVSARDKDVLQAQSKANTAIADIRTALIEAGIPEEDINTDYINIYAIYDYQEDQEELTAYSANSTLAIRTTDMEMVGEIIDLAFGAGANTLNNISFSAAETSEAEAEALREAVENATAKAEVLAAASGQEITGIEQINESGTFSFDRGVENNFLMKEEAAMDSAAAGTFAQSAKLTVSANISIIFAAEELTAGE